MSVATAENGQLSGEQQPENKPLTPFQRTRTWLQSSDFASAVSKALPKHMTPERFLRIALTAVMRTPKLANCTQESIFNCLLQLSQYGLEPDGRCAHLIPFDVRQGGQVVRTDCTLIIDFKGYAELVMRSGLVSSIHADIVCENDDFEYDRGFITRHKINFKAARGKAYAAYAVVRFKDGTEKCEVMSAEDILAIRDRSQGWIAFKKGWAKQSPWNPAEPVIEHEMWKKTAFRRVTKWVPLSAEIRQAFADEDTQEEKIRLLDLRDAWAAVEQTGTKSDQLAAMMEQRRRDQDDEGPQDEPANNGEASQVESEADPKAAMESEIADKMMTAIGTCNELAKLDEIANEVDLLTTESIRVRMQGEIASRRAVLKRRTDGKLM